MPLRLQQVHRIRSHPHPQRPSFSYSNWNRDISHNRRYCWSDNARPNNNTIKNLRLLLFLFATWTSSLFAYIYAILTCRVCVSSFILSSSVACKSDRGRIRTFIFRQIPINITRILIMLSYLFHLDIHRNPIDEVPELKQCHHPFCCTTHLTENRSNVHCRAKNFVLLPRYCCWVGKYFDRHSFDLFTRSSWTTTNRSKRCERRKTYVAQGQRDLQILTKTLGKFRIHVDHFE